MADQKEKLPVIDWNWDAGERSGLTRRFGTELLHFLKAINAWPRNTDNNPHAARFGPWAERFLEAAGALDVCAANCHAVAGALRALSDSPDVPDAAAGAATRLHSATGKRVVLTRTTIPELSGRTLAFQSIEGHNAIVEVDRDYWVTPLDRVLVVDHDQVLAEAKKPVADQEVRSADAPADTGKNATPGNNRPFSFHLRRGEISNTIQFLTMTGRTGMLTLSCTSTQRPGRVVVRESRVLSARFAEYQSIMAVAQMMRCDGIEAEFQEMPVNGDEVSITLTTEQLLIEAAVTADELPA